MAQFISLVAQISQILTACSTLLPLPPPGYPFLGSPISTGFASVTQCKAPFTEAVSIATLQAPTLSQVPSFTTGPDS
jgi:hypothetical protein